MDRRLEGGASVRTFEIICQTTYGSDYTHWHHGSYFSEVTVEPDDEADFDEVIKDPDSRRVSGVVRHPMTGNVIFRLVGVRRGLSGRCLVLICESVIGSVAVAFYTWNLLDGAGRSETMSAATEAMNRCRIENFWHLRSRRAY